MRATKRRTLALVIVVLAAISGGLAYLLTRPSDFEIAARELPSAIQEARELGLALSWEEFHQQTGIRSGHELFPLNNRWKQPSIGSIDFESMSEEEQRDALAKTWPTYKKDLDELVVLVSDAKYSPLSPVAPHIAILDTKEMIATVVANAFLTEGAVVADTRSDPAASLKYLDAALRLADLAFQEPALLPMSSCWLQRNRINDAIRLIANAHKTDRQQLSRLLSVIGSHEPKVSFEIMVRAEFVDLYPVGEQYKNLSDQERFEAFRDRYTGYKKPPWSKPLERIREESNDMRARRVGGDRFAPDAISARHVQATVALVRALKTVKNDSEIRPVVEKWYRTTLDTGDKAILENETAFHLMIMQLENWEKINREYDGVLHDLKNMIAAVK